MTISQNESKGSTSESTNPTLDYWSQIYATTQSEALKQKAALILGLKHEQTKAP